MPSVHDGLLRHHHVGQGSAAAAAAQAMARPPSFGPRYTPGFGGPHPIGRGIGHFRPTHTGLVTFDRDHVGARGTAEISGQEDVQPAAGSAPDQSHYTPVSSGPVTDTSTPGGALSSLLGSSFGDLGGLFGGGGGGSNAVTAASVADSASQTNVPVSYNPPSGGGIAPAPRPAPTTIVQPQAAKSNLIWWIIGGVAAVAVGIIIWRHFGHKGVKAAAKAASYAFR